MPAGSLLPVAMLGSNVTSTQPGWGVLGWEICVPSSGFPFYTQRKSLRERWLMDGAAEKPEKPEDPTSKDSQSPEGQAQVRIRNLEDSLFT